MVLPNSDPIVLLKQTNHHMTSFLSESQSQTATCVNQKCRYKWYSPGLLSKTGLLWYWKKLEQNGQLKVHHQPLENGSCSDHVLHLERKRPMLFQLQSICWRICFAWSILSAVNSIDSRLDFVSSLNYCIVVIWNCTGVIVFVIYLHPVKSTFTWSKKLDNCDHRVLYCCSSSGPIFWWYSH